MMRQSGTQVMLSQRMAKASEKSTVDSIRMDSPARNDEQLAGSTASASAANASNDNELELDRVTLRLDGFEMYAFVASMTAGFSFSALDALSCVEHWPWPISLLFATSMVVSIFTGIFATLTFALCSLYAKTALAESKDERMYAFLKRTAPRTASGTRICATTRKATQKPLRSCADP